MRFRGGDVDNRYRASEEERIITEYLDQLEYEHELSADSFVVKVRDDLPSIRIDRHHLKDKTSGMRLIGIVDEPTPILDAFQLQDVTLFVWTLSGIFTAFTEYLSSRGTLVFGALVLS